MTSQELPSFTQYLPSLPLDGKEEIEKAIFELFLAGMWFDNFELRGAYVIEDDERFRLEKLLEDNENPDKDLVFNFRFRIPNKGFLKEVLDEILVSRQLEIEKSKQEQVVEIDRRIQELQEQRELLIPNISDVPWTESPNTMHPSFNG